jgi:hypothetical protein
LLEYPELDTDPDGDIEVDGDPVSDFVLNAEAELVRSAEELREIDGDGVTVFRAVAVRLLLLDLLTETLAVDERDIAAVAVCAIDLVLVIVAAIDTLCDPVTDTVFEDVLVEDDEGLSVNVAIDDSDGEELTDTDELVEGDPDGESLADDDPDETKLTVLHSEIDDDAVLVFIIYVSVVEVVAELVVLDDIVIVLDTNPDELRVGDDDCVLDGLDVPDTVPDLRGVRVIGGLLEVDMLTVEVLDCDTEAETVPELLIVFDTDILRVPVAQLELVFVTA